MTPRKVLDKGKAPMANEERQGRRPITRSRTVGIAIGEPVAVAPQVEARDDLEAEARPIGEASEAPIPTPARMEREHPGGEARGEPRVEATPDPSLGGVAEPSNMATPMTEGPVTNAQLAGFMQMMMGAVQNMQQNMQRFFETSQPRTSPNPTCSEMPGAQTRVQGQGQNEGEVQVVVMRQPMGEDRQRMTDERVDMQAFQGMHPPVFRGEADYRVVDEWVMQMEKIFEYLGCNDNQKVRYATFMLRGEADKWWRTDRETLPGRGFGLSWAEFLDLFFHQYIPTSEQIRRTSEFASLVQGKMSVAEYDIQFRSLSRFVTWTGLDPVARARKFQEGLNPSIRGKLAVLDLTDYSDILDRARRVEREEVEWAKGHDRKRGNDQGRQGAFQGRKQRPRLEQQQAWGQSTFPPECATCGRRHAGECKMGMNVCFGCGEEGHKKLYCPYVDMICFNCGQRGHRRERCPNPRMGGFRPGDAPMKVQQQPMIRAPVPGHGGQRGRPRPPQP